LPACINILDIDGRAESQTTMEKLLSQYLRMESTS